ncbi:MAG: hypothetical protein L0Z50_04540 [Verrucomicrobiales bacterium]|nr:hypothetical protein [Verrucomicrobiales bacterium]
MDKVVAQGSKPAVSQGFQPAAAKSNVPVGSDALPIWKSAIRQVWKPGLETCATVCGWPGAGPCRKLAVTMGNGAFTTLQPTQTGKLGRSFQSIGLAKHEAS